MHIAFATQAIRTICESQLKAERLLGVGEAADLRTILSTIEAASHLAELLQIYGIPMPIDGVVTIIENTLTLRVAPNHRELIRDDKGQVKGVDVTRIRVETIGDYS